MLEYSFTKLDDDFITIWSKYLLWHDANDIMPDLTRLAEKGQINAIQSWYLLKNQEEKNKIIEGIVNGYSGDTFNEALAIAHRTYDREKGKIQEIKDLVEKYCDLGDTLAEKTGVPADQNEHYAKVNVLVEDYQKTKYANQLRKAARITELDCASSKSVFTFERLFEIYQSAPMVLNKDRISNQTIMKARKILKKYVKQDPYDARSKFALAKNLVFFAQNEKEELEGAQILWELSKRPLNLEDSQEKGEF